MLVVFLGKAATSLSEVDIYTILAVATLIVIIAYLLRRRWLPDQLPYTTD